MDLLLPMVLDVLECLPVPARTPALPTVSQQVNLSGGGVVALSMLQPVCLYAAILNAPVMEPGATSSSTYHLPGERAERHPSAGSRGR